MLVSSRRGISYPNPDRSDRPDIPTHIENLLNALDVDVLYEQDTNAARLAAAHQASGGLFWWATDTKTLWYDDGTTWQQISETNGYGVAGSIPAANTVPVGYIYYESDTGAAFRSDGTNWIGPINPGAQLDYAQITSSPTLGGGATSEGAAQTIITGNSIMYDGSKVKIEAFAPFISATEPAILVFVLLRDSAILGHIATEYAGSTVGGYSEGPMMATFYDTPSAGAHTYILKAYSNIPANCSIGAGIGGSGNNVPAFLKATKA